MSQDKRILAIDPGTTESAYVWLGEGCRIWDKAKMPNIDMLSFLRYDKQPDMAAIEMIASYGMPVGAEVFETCVWIGRFWEVLVEKGVECAKVYRKDVKMYLCGTTRAKDSNIATAIVDIYDPQRLFGRMGKGTTKNRGPLYGFAKDMWAALAVGLYAQDHNHIWHIK